MDQENSNFQKIDPRDTFMEAMMDPKTTLIMPPAERMFCAAHLEPLRAEWPRGYAVLTTMMFNQIVNRAEFYEKMDRDAEGKYILEPQKASKVLHDLCPLCCLLGHEQMELMTSVALSR